jgi:hypothetical protein
VKDTTWDVVGPIFIMLMLGGTGLGIYMDCHRRKEVLAEAAPPAPLAISAAVEETLPDPSSAYVRTRIITDTATKRQYIVVYTSSGVAITPRLPAEKP